MFSFVEPVPVLCDVISVLLEVPGGANSAALLTGEACNLRGEMRVGGGN